MSELLLGIDIGTSSCKVAAYDINGNVVAVNMQEYKVYYTKKGFVEQKPIEWWQAICKATKQLLEVGKISASDIKAVGVDGQSWSAIHIDKDGEILFDNPIWMDTRAKSICEKFKIKIGEENIFNVCGNPFEPTYTTPKILWFKENFSDQFKRTYKVLQSNSYIVYNLTNKVSTDISQCYGFHFFNMEKGSWNKEMAKEMEVDLSLLPDIYKSHQIVGKITEKAANQIGLLSGTPVVAGGLDAACGTLGAGVIENGQTQEQGGQAGGMSICLNSYKPHKKLIMGYHVVPEIWLLQGGTVGGGGTLNWLKKSIFENLSFEQMSNLANEIKVGSDGLIFLPYMSGERSPIWDEKAKGVYFGLDYLKDKRHIIRSTMEGVAYSLNHNIKTAEQSDAFISTMNSIGGAANSKVWTQIKSDITGKPINVPSSDTGTTLGACILAGVGIGVYKDFKEAVNKTVKIKQSYIPNMENYEKYKKLYEIYLELYTNLKSTMPKI